MSGRSDGGEFRAPMPHCDSSILHPPGKCRYCDDYPDFQEMREIARINFTGEHDQDKAPCPSEYFRPDEVRDRWPGNVAVGPGEEPPPYPSAPLADLGDTQADQEEYAGHGSHFVVLDEIHRHAERPKGWLWRTWHGLRRP